MRTVGVRELKQHTSQILKRIREKGETVDVTYHGQVIARLVPVAPTHSNIKDVGAVWSDLDSLTEEIGRRWPVNESAAEAVSKDRR